MHRPRPLVTIVVVGALVALIGIVGVSQLAGFTTIQCDGNLPRWMLYAQDYDGGGCAEVLPFWQAPPGADWTEYCMGMCASDEVWPPPSG